MARAARPILLAVAAAFFVALVPTGASASVDEKPLPAEGCDLVDTGKLDAALGVSTDPPVVEPTVVPGSIVCTVPIPYDPETCTVQPAPGVSVAVGPKSAQPVTLQQAAELARQQDFDVRPLKGKAYGVKGAFLVTLPAGKAVTFFGGKGPYLVQIDGAESCGSVSKEQMTTAVQGLAKRIVKQI